MNQENMVQADHHTRSLSKDSTHAMFLLLLAGVGLAIFFGYGLQRAILKPIQTLTAVSKELGDGKLDQIVPVQSKDELGELADAFNKLATKLSSGNDRSNSSSPSDDRNNLFGVSRSNLGAFTGW
jgi:nitrogen fixation/metabolism regulation signal transduction histidine kinase